MSNSALRLMVALLAWWWAVPATDAQPNNDKVVIADATDSYVFTEANGQLMVKNRQETTFELTGSLSQTIQPYAIYSDHITIDKAVCGRLKANHHSATSNDVFHDDSRICYFTDELTTKHQRQTARFERTFCDARYLARVPLQDDYFVRHKTLSFTIPIRLGVRVVGFNLPTRATLQARQEGADSVFTFTVDSLPARSHEAMAPPFSLTGCFVLVVGVFQDYADLYSWLHAQMPDDTAIDGLDGLIAEMTDSCTTDDERLANTFRWMQQHIRYVAVEDGEGSYRPDRPTEVLRKRYGDCKGMSLLLATLLRAQGFDARMVHIGTRDVTLNVSSHPTLASLNHAVCAVVRQGQPLLFLDATCRYLPVGYIPQHIQGREAIIADGADGCLVTVPTLPIADATDSLVYDYQLDLDARQLRGQAVCCLSGDMKELFMRRFAECPVGQKATFLSIHLNDDDRSMTVADATWQDDDTRHIWAVFGGTVLNSHAVQAVGGRVYVELNPHNSLFATRIDTTHRESDIYLPLQGHVVRRVRLQVPPGYEVEHLPQGISLPMAQGELSCCFEQQGSTVELCQRLTLTEQLIRRDDIPLWNQTVARWQDACNEQIILRKTE